MTAPDKYYKTLYGVRRSIRYHQRRRSYFEFLNNCIMFWHIVAGSSTVVFLFGNISQWGGAGIAGSSALLAALNLVLGIPRRMTWHATLSQKFAQLEHDMSPFEDNLTIDPTVESRFRQKRLEIEADEPPKLRVIDLLCHNELVQSTYTHDKVYDIGLIRWIVGHVIDLEVGGIVDKPRENKPFNTPPQLSDPDTAVSP